MLAKYTRQELQQEIERRVEIERAQEYGLYKCLKNLQKLEKEVDKYQDIINDAFGINRAISRLYSDYNEFQLIFRFDDTEKSVYFTIDIDSKEIKDYNDEVPQDIKEKILKLLA